MHQLSSTKRARVTSNAIHLPGSRILHYVRFRYPIVTIGKTQLHQLTSADDDGTSLVF
jgi:hypothetical protein